MQENETLNNDLFVKFKNFIDSVLNNYFICFNFINEVKISSCIIKLYLKNFKNK